ncbi:MAG: inner membrane CreD family protein [Gammaproteobacteria bacterium]
MSPGFLSGQQTTIRFAVIGVIVLAMLIPLAMVEGVTEERQSFFDATLGDIARSWGSEQDVAGPFLVVPEAYRYQVKTDQGELVWRTTETERVYLPSTLNLDAEVAHQYRRRSIYEVPVYSANLGFSGSFAALDARPADEQREVRLDRARLVVGISHTQAISNASTATVGDREIAFGPGTDQTWVGTGIHVLLDDYRGKAMNFSFDLAVKGTSKLG